MSTPRPIELPAGRSTPFAGHAAVWSEAAATCRGVRTLQAMVVLGGRTGVTRLRRMRTRTALARPASLRLEGLAPFGAPVFVLAARPGEATLVLPRDRRVLHGAPASDLLHVLAGLTLDPADVRALLTGCLVPDPSAVSARRIGDAWFVVDLVPPAKAYLRRIDGELVVAFGRRGDVTVEYRDHRQGLPRQVRIVAGAEAATQTDLTLTLSQLNVNTVLAPETFTVDAPASFLPITLEELRQAVPTAAPATAADR